VSAVIRFASALIVGIIIFLGLPLLGWGLTDPQGFAAHPARLGYVVLVVLLQIFVVFKFPEVGRNNRTGTKTVQRQRLVVFLMQLIPLALLIAAPFGDRWNIAALEGAEVIRYLGLGLFALGFLAMNWAEAALGKQFSIQVTIQKDHQLVTGGLYRYLRHPRYLGIALVFRSGLGLVLAAALLVVPLWRMHDEETFMHQEFGRDWETYSKKSWRLIPFVY
jgi:protein-S-isoprenylcysteine O-methyltransferase Ste14